MRIIKQMAILLALLAIPVLCFNRAVAQDGASAGFKVGFVNIQMVFDKYEKTIELNEYYKTMERKAQDEFNVMKKSLDEILQKMESLNKDSEEFRRLQLDKVALEGKLNYFGETKEKELMDFLLTNTEMIYIKIRGVIEEYGKANGYSLILKVDAFTEEAIHSSSLPMLNDKIQSRPVLFYDAGLDITNVIIEEINKTK